MRNLKRALSLALASVMLLGMMVVGTSAASFPDVDDNDNVEAIEVLKAVNVMIGDNGYFKPDEPVTRNEMAVIMTNMMGLNPADFANSCPFTDVQPWAQNYVAACYANGIIAGRSATVFDGQATVTAVEAAAMMMRALGYFQNSGDYQNGFVAATVRQAAEINLFKNVTGNTNTPMNRNNVAQLALNTLESDVVDFTGNYGTDIKTADGTTIQVNYVSKYDPKSDRVGYDYKGDGYTSGVGNTHQATYLQLCEKLYENDLKKVGSQADKAGRPAVEWTYKGQSVKASEAASVIFATKQSKSDIEKALKNYKVVITAATSGSPAVTRGMTDVSVTSADSILAVQGKAAVALSTGADSVAKTISDLTANGKAVEIYTNSSNQITKIVVLTYGVAKVQSISDTKDGDYRRYNYTLSDGFQGRTGYTDPDKDSTGIVHGDVAKDDIVIVLQLPTETHMWPAESFTGTQTAYNAGDNSITVNGQKYKVAVGTQDTYDSTYTDGTKLVAMSDFSGYNDKEITCYVDLYGNVIKAEGVSSKDYAVIDEIRFTSGAGDLSGSATAKLIFATGETKTVTLNELTLGSYTAGFTSDATPSGTQASTNKHGVSPASVDANETKWHGLLVTYVERSDGKYDVTVKGKGATAGTSGAISAPTSTAIVTKGVPSMSGTGLTGIRGNDSTIYLVKSKSGSSTVYNAYTGYQNVPSITNGDTAGFVTWVENSNTSGLADYIFIDVSKSTTGSDVDDSTVKDVAYIFDYTKVNVVGTGADRQYIYTDAAINGEKPEAGVVADKNSYFGADGLYEVKLNSNNVVVAAEAAGTGSTKFTAAKSVTASASNGTLTTEVKTYTYDKDKLPTVYVIDNGDIAASTPEAAEKFDSVYIKVKSSTGTAAEQIAIDVMYVVKANASTSAILPGSATVTDVIDALANKGNVTTPSGMTIGSAITVGDDKVLNLNAATVNANITVDAGGEVNIKGNLSGSGAIVLNGGKVTIDSASAVTTVPKITGDGDVVVNKNIAAASPAATVVGMIGDIGTGSATASSGGTVAVPQGTAPALSGSGKITSFDSGRTMKDLADRTGSSKVTFYELTLTGTASGDTITGEWTRADNNKTAAVFGSGATLDGDPLLVAVGDNVKSVTYTVTDISDSNAQLTYTFYFNGYTAPTGD